MTVTVHCGAIIADVDGLSKRACIRGRISVPCFDEQIRMEPMTVDKNRMPVFRDAKQTDDRPRLLPARFLQPTRNQPCSRRRVDHLEIYRGRRFSHWAIIVQYGQEVPMSFRAKSRVPADGVGRAHCAKRRVLSTWLICGSPSAAAST